MPAKKTKVVQMKLDNDEIEQPIAPERDELPDIEQPIEPSPEPEPEPEPEPPTEPEPEPEPPTEPEPEVHDERVARGGECSVCGWKWGDDTAHPVEIMPQNIAAGIDAIPAAKAARVPPEPDPKACPPVALQGKCPKCNWTSSGDTEGNPHPIIQ